VSGAFAQRLKAARTIGRLAPAYATFGILKHVVSIKQLARWAWSGRCRDRDPDVERRVVTAVAHLRSWFGRDEDCLQSSLLLYRELSRLGAEPMLTVGFRRQNDHVEGHAWVSVDGHAVANGRQEQLFTTAFQFGPGGALVSPLDASAGGHDPRPR
jgi:hypothetical protein